MKLKRNLTILIFVMAILLIGCSNKALESNSKNKPMVVVSIVPQKTFVKAVAGDLVDVTVMIPPGNSPANYQPSPKEMKDLSKSLLYFSIGVPTEEVNILPKIKDFNNKIKVVSLADEVGKIYPHRYFENDNDRHSHDNEDEHNHSGRDPHIWLSPKRVKIMVDVIADELGKLDPNNKDIYEKNAKEYIEKLDNLDKDIRDVLSDVNNRAFIIYHPVLGYFADDYNLEMISIEKEGKEATVKGIQEIIDTAKKKNIKVIFYQAEIDSPQTKVLAEEIGGKIQIIEPLAPNYIENMKKIAYTFKQVLKPQD
ncbi:metal ABC transporter solute-binding protein, Zn/Mn family [Thermohalobacter berrensis]|uniref:ABC transporter substrate-binding protein n=1 Tax=Thermohalobacter berrensis TaxID=99594 RepID=A0A419SWF1_9FIRM|nr:zinc ABC transporter substrate-binding protein [Thermohalobacter berrensis]RKD29558.1 ABC transporter substrate-binding protein [Thermohalobacter berrensis]